MEDQARHVTSLVFVPVLTLTLMCSSAYAQSAPPSGTFGFVAAANQMDSAGQNGGALAGILNFDGAGNVSGNAVLKSRSPNGGAAPVTTAITGTYTSNPDGTISTTLSFDIGFSATFAMVPTDGGPLAIINLPNPQFFWVRFLYGTAQDTGNTSRGNHPLCRPSALS